MTSSELADLLWQASYVLRDLHTKHPDCGYLKMSNGCKKAWEIIIAKSIEETQEHTS